MACKPPIPFRAAASDGSRGLNTADEIDPLFGRGSQYHEDLATMPHFDARMMIRDHVNYNYNVNRFILGSCEV